MDKFGNRKSRIAYASSLFRRPPRSANPIGTFFFGKDYRGGISLAARWLAGSLGGGKRIIVSPLADKGSVEIFSSGSVV
jgi:hypothetical protein